ncbi:DegV family protein [bacterium]|nr:DegV family protein [bacterium]
MEKIAIVTDSTSDLPDEILKQHEVYRAPLKVYFGQEEYWDRETITPEQFFIKLESTKTYPRTSQTTSKRFFELFQDLVQKGYTHILCILISSQISKTVETAQFASSMISHAEVRIIDSKLTSYAMAFLALYARDLANRGQGMNEIAEQVVARIPKAQLLFSVDNLDALERGGRIGKASAFFGNLMGVRPILAITGGHGKIEVVDKVKSTQAANEVIAKLTKRHADMHGIIQGICIMHTVRKENSQALKLALIDQGLNSSRIAIREVGAVLGTHLGDKSWGLAIC